jgi:hypothetical protein
MALPLNHKAESVKLVLRDLYLAKIAATKGAAK